MIFGHPLGKWPSIILSSLAAEGKYVVPGIILLAGFVWAERRSRYPLLQLSLLGRPNARLQPSGAHGGWGRLWCRLSRSLVFICRMFCITRHLKQDPACCRSTVGVLVGTPLTGYRVPRIGAKKTFALGLFLSCLGLFMLRAFLRCSNYFLSLISPGIFLSGLGSWS